MNPSPTLIDEIVRQVMNTLSKESARGELAASYPVRQDKPVMAPSALTQKVITEETLSKLALSVKAVTVAKTAIITPAAHDYARDRGITIHRDQPSAQATSISPTKGLCLIDSRSDNAMGAWNDVTRRSTSWTTERLADTSSIVSRIASSIRDTPQIIVLSSEPWNVACLANRNESIRAAVACHLDDIPAIQKSLAPNVWCVDSVKPYFELRNILRCLISETSVPSVARKPLL
ncbi:hypothetical protein [Lacunimicrobium album]